MMTETLPITAEGAIWTRLLQAQDQPLSLAAARALLRLEFAPPDRERMRDLAAKARAGQLTDADREALTNYERVGNLLALMKSRARQRLKSAPTTRGPKR